VCLLTITAVLIAAGATFPALGDWPVIGEGCGDGIVQSGEECDPGYPDLGIPPELLGRTCESEGFGAGTLTCTPDCEIDFTACYCEPVTPFPATGQTTCYCPGDDGEVTAGAALSYTDNGDGTITDNNTMLMWEKKDDGGGIHDQHNEYGWTEALSSFLGALNDTCEGEGLVPCDSDDLCGAGGQCGFAGYRDWRLPNVKELQSILNYQAVAAVSAPLKSPCLPGCAGPECSCTRWSYYWSSSTYAAEPNRAWSVRFKFGHVTTLPKGHTYFVRAVRGGL
jgi:hypothetical protein